MLMTHIFFHPTPRLMAEWMWAEAAAFSARLSAGVGRTSRKPLICKFTVTSEAPHTAAQNYHLEIFIFIRRNFYDYSGLSLFMGPSYKCVISII